MWQAHRAGGVIEAANGYIQIAIWPKGQPIRALLERKVSEIEGWRHTSEVKEACIKASHIVLSGHNGWSRGC